LTSTEVDQLKNIGENAISNAEWGYVAGMQGVSVDNSPNFSQIVLKSTQPSGPTIQLPSDANSGSLHLQVRDIAGDAPGMYLGGHGDSVLYGVNEGGTDVWNIDQLGNFSGQSALSTYATNLTGTPSISVTNVTASGHISSSGVIKGYQLHSSGGIYPTLGAGTSVITGLTNDNIQISNGLYVHDNGMLGGSGGHITASGNISSSGMLIAERARFGTSIASIPSTTKLYVSGHATLGSIETANATVNGAFEVIGHITASGDISASGDALFGGDAIIDGNISERGSLISLVYAPRIGSSYITTLGTIGTGTWQGTKVSSLYLDDDTAHLTTDQTFTGNKTFSGALTASSGLTVEGNISASGTLHTFGGTIRVGTNPTYTLADIGPVGGDVAGLMIGYDSTLSSISYGKDSDNKHLFYGQALEAQGNISASGYFSTETNITASGDISASGDIIATPQLQYNTSSISTTGNVQGDIIKFGNTTTVAGAIYAHTGSGWVLAHSGSLGNASSSLGLATGTNSTTDGMLLRGMANIGYDPGGNNGCALYLEAPGSASSNIPSTSGHVSRVVAWNYGSNTIYFNPDNTWVTLS